jgi:hypothetical protein
MDDSQLEQAKQRARSAGARANELRDRLARLDAGERSSSEDVTRARAAADEALQRGAAAHDRAATAHDSAAKAHRSAADVADAIGRHESAEHHRDAAGADERAADVDREAAAADRGDRE